MKDKTNNTQLTETQKQELSGYAEQVTEFQTQIVSNDNIAVQHGKKSLELAIKAGETLCAAKNLVKHGEWEKWVTENVPTVSKRTVENYMKLAKKAKEPGYATLVDDAGTLRAAYIRVGIYNKTPAPEPVKTEQPNPENADGETEAKAEDETTPAKMKEENKGQYDAKWNEARQNAISHVRKAITEAEKVNWDLSTWEVINSVPRSDEEANHGAALFESLKIWAAKHEYKGLKREDEIITKTGVILNEVVKSFILATNTEETHHSLQSLAESGRGFSMVVNSVVPSIAEPMAA